MMIIGNYKVFALHLRMPLLVQDKADHDDEKVESSIANINHAELEDLRPDEIKYISRGVTNTGDSSLPLKHNHNADPLQRR